ncbi:LysE family translocator [Bartonella sp. CL100XZDX]|uniref:LysE family translocator n=1 Tax=Bartonella sp. CL100XZDX TaxID=3243515 RepID=UPI0035CE9A59
MGHFPHLGVSALILNNKTLFFLVKLMGIGKTKLLTSYIDGFMTQILNPKVSIFYIAAFPKFLSSGGGIKKGFELVTIHSFNIFAWFTLMTIFISFASTALKKQRVKGSINIATGTVLSLFSFFIFFG